MLNKSMFSFMSVHSNVILDNNITNKKQFVTESSLCVQGHDPLTFSFLSSFLFFDWVGVLGSEVLNLSRCARRVLFPPESLQ